MADETEARTIGIRDVLGGVNLRDFFDMVRGEAGLVWAGARNAARAHPLLIPFAFLLVLVRLLLLLGVIVVLGGAILLISAVRGVSRLASRGRAGEQEESEDNA